MPDESLSALRSVAVFEAVKGAIVMVAGLGLAAMIHHDLQQLAESLVLHLHLNPARQYPRIFIDAVARVHDVRLWMLASTAGCYAALRFLEAYGLWNARAWAEWLAVVSGGIYMPFEIYELSRGINPLRIATFVCNALVVAVMVRALLQRREARARGAR